MAVPAPTARLRVGIVGAGWAGLAAAVRACQDGHAVTLFEMAPQTGGRARSLSLPASEHHPALALDNGQHILIGAYSATLALMQQVGVDLDQALLRRPLTLVDHQGRGLRLQPGHALLSFPRAVLAQPHWRWRERGALLAASVGWLLRGFACPADWTAALASSCACCTMRCCPAQVHQTCCCRACPWPICCPRRRWPGWRSAASSCAPASVSSNCCAAATVPAGGWPPARRPKPPRSLRRPRPLIPRPHRAQPRTAATKALTG
jgi:hypothetical protein